MKFIYLVSIILCSSSTFAQNKIDLTYFTLGLVDDYGGRFIVKSDKLEPTKIDQFHEKQAYIMDLLDSLIKEQNKSRDREDQIASKRIRVKERNCIDCNEYFNYYSKILSEDLNKNYRFRFSHNWDLKDRKLYRGRIKISDFKNDAERISFLSGSYLVSGRKERDIFVYHLANSVEKFDLIVKSLKKLKCEIKDVIVEGGVPANERVYFIPTEELKIELDSDDRLRERVGK